MKLIVVSPPYGEGRPVIGYDSVIAVAPADIYTMVDGKRAIVAARALPHVRRLSEQGAAGVGEELHHADWVITSDPAEVRTIGLMHDCDGCRAGVANAQAFLRDHPGCEVMVGALYWAGKANEPEISCRDHRGIGCDEYDMTRPDTEEKSSVG